ncbi:MAG: hypothetical protein LBS70_00365, partial [Candidatus Accumulibacter sp.]|nr:hypothetical protein [Accumulibacter sp.]
MSIMDKIVKSARGGPDGEAVFPRRSGAAKWVLGVLAGAAIVGVTLWGLLENVPAGYICVIQSPITGDLDVYTEPGIKLQKFGKITYYPRSGIFEFLQPVDPNDPAQARFYNVHDDRSYKITFSDGGDAWMPGSIRYDYPLEHQQITTLHKIFSGHDAVVKGLVEKTVERSIYMSGPLMTSIESALSRKSELPQFIEDQARNGLYSVVTKEVTVTDEITKETKRVKQAEIISDPNAPNGRARQEESVLAKYGMSLSNLSMGNISYSKRVQESIDKLFDAQRDIQIATLNAKKAEQDRRTAEEKGRADATTAEWRAKTIAAEEIAAAEKEARVQQIAADRDKVVAVTQAQRHREVAELDKQTAELYKVATLLRAEADSEARRKLMAADGALAQKIEAYKYAVDKFASAMENYKGAWVPQITAGGNTGGNSA